MSEWMNVSVNEWVSEWIRAWWVNEWVSWCWDNVILSTFICKLWGMLPEVRIAIFFWWIFYRVTVIAPRIALRGESSECGACNPISSASRISTISSAWNRFLISIRNTEISVPNRNIRFRFSKPTEIPKFGATFEICGDLIFRMVINIIKYL